MISLKSIRKDNDPHKKSTNNNSPNLQQTELLDAGLELVDYINQVIELFLNNQLYNKELKENLSSQSELIAKEKEILTGELPVNTSDLLHTLASLNQDACALNADFAKLITYLEQNSYINFNDILSFLTQLRFILEKLKTDSDSINK